MYSTHTLPPSLDLLRLPLHLQTRPHKQQSLAIHNPILNTTAHPSRSPVESHPCGPTCGITPCVTSLRRVPVQVECRLQPAPLGCLPPGQAHSRACGGLASHTTVCTPLRLQGPGQREWLIVVTVIITSLSLLSSHTVHSDQLEAALAAVSTIHQGAAGLAQYSCVPAPRSAVSVGGQWSALAAYANAGHSHIV